MVTVACFGFTAINVTFNCFFFLVKPIYISVIFRNLRKSLISCLISFDLFQVQKIHCDLSEKTWLFSGNMHPAKPGPSAAHPQQQVKGQQSPGG